MTIRFEANIAGNAERQRSLQNKAWTPKNAQSSPHMMYHDTMQSFPCANMLLPTFSKVLPCGEMLVV
jgi:hypothetical protein